MHKPLYRVRKGSLIAGVCTGCSRYFGVPVSLVRLIWILITLTAGAGLLLYLILALFLPAK